MKKYQFTIGEENPRVYEGTLISPLAGMKLGARVAKILSGACSSVEIKEDLLAAYSSNDVSTLIKFIADCLPQLDTDNLQSIFLEILEKASFFVKLESDSRVTAQLRSQMDIDKWFEEYREDLFIVAANAIARNCAPFFPKELKNLLSTTG